MAIINVKVQFLEDFTYKAPGKNFELFFPNNSNHLLRVKTKMQIDDLYSFINYKNPFNSIQIVYTVNKKEYDINIPVTKINLLN